MNQPPGTLPYAVDFDAASPEALGHELRARLADARAAIDGLLAQPPPGTWSSTAGALDVATAGLDEAWGLAHHLRAVRFSDALDAVVSELTPDITAFYTSLGLDSRLYALLTAFAATPEAAALPPDRARYLHRTIDAMRRRGAGLDAAAKERLQALSGELAELANTFSRNVLGATMAWSLDLDAPPAGLPATALSMLASAASAAGREGWRVTLSAPVVTAILLHAEERALRETVWHAWNHRAAGPPHDNAPVVARMLSLRHEQATLLGYADFADLVLEDRMARSGDAASAFVDEVEAAVQPAFAREQQELQAFARARGGPDPLMPWDVSFYAERQRHAMYELDDEELRPYFPFERVLDGLFGVVSALFGVQVRKASLPSWHADATVFEIVDDDGRLLGALHADFFPRADKRDGAWMNALMTGHGGTDRPHVGVICGNLTPPAGGRPALLTHREVETLFHEMGHLLHHLLTETELRGQAGTNVAWDFVELPSQIMENWCWEREALARISGHWQTGEPMPDALFERMLAARNFRAASFIMRQLGFCRLDLDLHRAPSADPIAQARAILRRYTPAPLPDDYAMVTAFSHLFADPVGYAAGYYSYQWAAVLDADAFSRFQAEGIFNHETGRAFRATVLANGDASDPGELFRAFMGREPDPQAMLRRAGLAA